MSYFYTGKYVHVMCLLCAFDNIKLDASLKQNYDHLEKWENTRKVAQYI